MATASPQFEKLLAGKQFQFTGEADFDSIPGSRYAFDRYVTLYRRSVQLSNKYELIGTAYRVAAKLMVPGETEGVIARIKQGYNPLQLMFTNGKGDVFTHKNYGSTGREYEVTLPGGIAGDAQELYAWDILANNDTVALGKLLVPSYTPANRNVVVIPVGKAKVNIPLYEQALNRAYAPLGIRYTVAVDESFRDNTDWDMDGNGAVQAAGSNLLSNDYVGEEAAMVSAYVAHKGGETNIAAGTAYFFAVSEVARLEEGHVGKMPHEEQFGFLYVANVSEATMARTVAHEVGHGAYHLEHTFLNIYLGDSSKGTTANLMDYGDDYALWKLQWDIVHDPGHVWGVLKRDRDAAFYSTAGKHALDDITGIDCYGKVIVGYSFKDPNYYVRPVLQTEQDYIITGFAVFDLATNKINRIIRCQEFATDEFLKLDTAVTPVNAKIYRPSPNKCTYTSQTILNWEYDKSSDESLNKQIADKVSELSWNNVSLYFNHDLSCVENFVEVIRQRDRRTICTEQGKIAEDLSQLRSILSNPQLSKKEIAEIVNNVCLSSLGGLNFSSELMPIFKRLVLPSTISINEPVEIAILRVMDEIKTTDYSDFFDILQDKNNEISKVLVTRMNDVSVKWWMDNKNYTNYIGALIYMIRNSPDSYKEKMGTLYPDLSNRIFSLNPTQYSLDGTFAGSEYWASGVSFTSKYYFEGIYNSETGKITIRRRIVREKNSTTTKFVSTDLFDRTFAEIPDVDPLTPIIVSVENELPLVRTALDVPTKDLKVITVPAIFFKFRNDKILEEMLKTTASISLDVAALAFSGGALTYAKNISRAQRIFAMYELADAAGSLALTTNVVDPNSQFGKVVSSYNTGMAIIGVGTGFVTISEFYNKLNPSTKGIVDTDGSLVDKMRLAYADYKQKFDDLKSSPDWNNPDKISADTKLKLEAQHDFFRILNGAGNLFSKLDDFPHVQAWVSTLNKTSDADLIAKVDRMVAADIPQLTKLDNYLNGASTAFKNTLKEAGRLDAWKFIDEAINPGVTTQFAKDPATLNKVAEMMQEGSGFRNALGENTGNALSNIIKFNSDLKCSTCGNAGRPYRSSMEEFLGEVEHFVTNFDIANQSKGKRFYNLLQGKKIDGTSLTNKELPTFDELHQTIKYLKDNPNLSTGTIEGFGLKIGNTSKYGDIINISGPPKYVELKSLLQGTGPDDGLDVLSGLNATPLKNRTHFYTQFKDGYLKAINNIEELRYVFDARKLGANGEDFIKNQFKDLFQSKKVEIFDAMKPELKASLFGQNPATQMQFLEAMINDLNSDLYKFIKAQ